jgi:hypothetical protein
MKRVLKSESAADTLRRYMKDEGWDHGLSLLEEALDDARDHLHRFPIDTDTCECGRTGKEWMEGKP